MLKFSVDSNIYKRQKGGILLVELDASVYSSSACLRAAHGLSANYTIKVDQDGPVIRLSVVETGRQELGDQDVSRILRVVTDYTLRERLDVETAPVRNAILAAAFGNAQLPIRERAHE